MQFESIRNAFLFQLNSYDRADTANHSVLDRNNCTCYHKSQIIYHAKKRRVHTEKCRRELRQVKRSALECVEYGLGAGSAE